MRYLVYGDLQAEEGSQRRYADNSNLQIWRVEQFFKFAAKLFKGECCDGVIDLGDTTDNRSSLSLPTISAISRGIRRFGSKPENNYKLIGNHEQWVKSGTVHTGGLYDGVFQVFPSFGSAQIEGRKIAFASFPKDDPTDLMKFLEEGGDFVFGHFQLEGAKSRGGALPGGISKDFLRKFRGGLFGHIHNFQEVAQNVHYLGSPFQQDFGEAGQKKYVAVVDINRSAPSQRTVSVQFVAVPNFPEYRVLTLEEFRALAVPEGSENRYKVVIQNPLEATEFFNMPTAYMAEPDYRYAEITKTSVVEPAHKSQEDFVLAYVEKTPFAHISDDLTVEDMLEIGKRLVA